MNILLSNLPQEFETKEYTTSVVCPLVLARAETSIMPIELM